MLEEHKIKTTITDIFKFIFYIWKVIILKGKFSFHQTQTPGESVADQESPANAFKNATT